MAAGERMLNIAGLENIASCYAFCCTCQQPLGVKAAKASLDPMSDAVRVVLSCHGAYEVVLLPSLAFEIVDHGRMRRALRVFLRPWTKHGELGQAGRLLRAGRHGMHPC